MNKRERAVGYMRKMATGCRWKVLHEIHYTKTDGSEIVLMPGIWYTGIPYTQGKKKRRYQLLRFKLNLFGGVFFYRKSLIGNDCSSAVSYAWKKINRKIPVLSTKKIFRDLCGPQKHFSHEERYRIEQDCLSTCEIIQSNSVETMDQAFRALKEGDGLLQYDGKQRKGHIMLVSNKANEEDTVMVIDQKGFGKDGSERDDTSWRVDLSYSYAELKAEGYIPVYLRQA